MERAMVLIGVQNAPAFTKLKAVHTGLAKMKTWALAQDIAEEDIVVISDEAPESIVTSSDIFKQTNSLLDKRQFDQLIVYFSGHGVNKGSHEYWLLTDAPDDASAAIHVSESALKGAHCGVPHVVLISDCCRTPVESIATGSLIGTALFKSQIADQEGRVDSFYATSLGRPSLEIADPTKAATHTGVYTKVLVEALTGAHSSVVQKQENATVVRPWPLNRKLPELVSSELHRRGVPKKVRQGLEPRAVLSSDPEHAVLAVLPATVASSVLGDPLSGGRMPYHFNGRLAQQVLRDSTGRMSPIATVIADQLSATSGRNVEQAYDFLAITDDSAPKHYETRSGVYVSGTTVTSVDSPHLFELSHSDHASAVRTYFGASATKSANVYLEFATDTCAVVPIFEEYLTKLVFDGTDLVSVGIDLMDDSPWKPDQDPDLTGLRSVVAGAVIEGRFQLNPLEAQAVGDQLRQSKRLDPALAVYAAYAFTAIGQQPHIEDMLDYQINDLDAALFDVVMTSGGTSTSQTYPFFPMLTQGWGLLEHFMGDHQRELYNDLRPHVQDSLWTHFSLEAAPILRYAIDNLR